MLMVPYRPIPIRFLPYEAIVRCPDDEHGGYGGPIHLRHVGFELEQRAAGDAHRSADAGAGTVYIDYLNTDGAFEVPVGSRIEIQGRSLSVRLMRRVLYPTGYVHHWELEVA